MSSPAVSPSTSAKNVRPGSQGLVERARGERFERSLHVVPVVAERRLGDLIEEMLVPPGAEPSDRDAVRWIGEPFIGRQLATHVPGRSDLPETTTFQDLAPGDVLGHDPRPDRGSAGPAGRLGLGPGEQASRQPRPRGRPGATHQSSWNGSSVSGSQLPCANASTPSGPVTRTVSRARSIWGRPQIHRRNSPIVSGSAWIVASKRWNSSTIAARSSRVAGRDP